MKKSALQKEPNFGSRAIKKILSLPPLLWVIVLIFVFFGFAAPRFFNLSNFINVLRQGAFLWMLSTVTTLVLISGGLDLYPLLLRPSAQ